MSKRIFVIGKHRNGVTTTASVIEGVVSISQTSPITNEMWRKLADMGARFANDKGEEVRK